MWFLWFILLYSSNCEAVVFYNITGNDPLLASNLPTTGYGKFTTKTLFMETCDDIGSNIDSDNRFVTNFLFRLNPLNQAIVNGYIVVPNNTRIQKLNMAGEMYKNGKFQTIVNNTGVTRCNHVGMSSIKMMIDVDENCAVSKGNHTLKSFKPDDLFHKALGSKSMYGRSTLKIEYFNENGLVFCTYSIQDFLPLPKNKKKN